MSKTKRYLLIFSTILFVLTAFYLGLIFSGTLLLGTRAAIIISIINVGIYIPASLLIAFGLNSKAENFVMRFMSITTFQMIAAMSVMAAFIFVKYPNAKMIVFHFLILFCAVLTVQTVMLVKEKNSI